MNRSTPGLPVHHQLPQFTQTHAHWVSDVIQPSPLLSAPSTPAPNPSSIRVFSNKSTLHMRWPKYWSFSFSISPSNEYPGLISFRMEWLELLAVQGTLKSLLQYQFKSINFGALSFLTVQLSHPYMTTGKTIALTRWTFIGKVMSLLFILFIFFLQRKYFYLYNKYPKKWWHNKINIVEVCQDTNRYEMLLMINLLLSSNFPSIILQSILHIFLTEL